MYPKPSTKAGPPAEPAVVKLAKERLVKEEEREKGGLSTS